ncbi:MAG TPA: 2-dehydropantoate 2-reductase N-terminal domain-containing protein, partial [Terricaulis sp.]|nr:2-dehydropantoate 2-reductase N-terminal domain-containing protein [Terricaulis sp.]
MTQPFQRVAVVGAGAWGTALAQVAAAAGRDVTLWAREAEAAEAINTRQENALFLPGIALNPAVKATTDLAVAAEAELILAVPPAQHMRAVLAALAPLAGPKARIVLCAKGVERGTLALMTDVLAEALP